MPTKVLYNKPDYQKEYEKEHIINILKELVPKASSNRKRAIKLPEYISFNISENILTIHINEFCIDKNSNIIYKNYTCENMQTDNAAFEGWAICLKAWLESINKVELNWDIPSPSNKNLHYNRFLYRVIRFQEAFSEWFSVSRDKKAELDTFLDKFINIQNNSYSKPPELKKKRKGGIGETEIEHKLANEFKTLMMDYYSIIKIDRQFPIGLKSNKTPFFTGRMSAIDLWGNDLQSLTVIELKYITKTSNNIKVGIISELFLYSCVMRDIIRGLIKAPEFCPKNNETELYNIANNLKLVKAEMLSNEYHPLIENEIVFKILNKNNFENNIPIVFNKSYYKYDCNNNVFSINR